MFNSVESYLSLVFTGTMTQKAFYRVGPLEKHPGGLFVLYIRKTVCIYTVYTMCTNYPLQFQSFLKASAPLTFIHGLYLFQVKSRKEDSEPAYINTNPKTRNKKRLNNPTPRFICAPH